MSESAFFAPIFIGLWVLSLCAPALAETNPRYIDEPYVLPLGQIETTFAATGSNLPIDHGFHLSSRENTFLSFDCRLRKPLDRSFTLNFETVGVGLQQELVSAPGFTRGVEWKLGSYHRGKWGLKPEFEGYLKRIYSEKWALVAQFNVSTFMPFDEDPSRVTVTLTSGSIWQINDSWSLLAKVQIAIRDAVVRNLFYESTDEIYQRDDYEIALPLALESRWRLSNTWDLSVEGSARAIGYNLQHQNYQVRLSVRAKM